MKKWIFILFLFVSTIASFLVAYKANSTPAFSLTIVCFIAFSVIYIVEVLDYKIGGQHLSLEKRINELQVEQKELKNITSSLLKIIYISLDSSRRWGGSQPEHQELLKKHMDSLSKYFESDLEENIQKDLEQIDKSIKERNKK